MRIGLTYDLRDEYLRAGFDPEAAAEFDSAETITGIEDALAALGHQSDRIGGVRALTRRLAANERWDLVFNIAEGVSGAGREAQVPALLDAFEIPYTFSEPLPLALALHKGLCKTVVRAMGIATPDFAVVERKSDVSRVNLPFPLFVKPMAEGSSKGISARSCVRTTHELADVCGELLQRFRQPVLVERFLPGREFTVGILGTGANADALGVLEVLVRSEAEPGAYSYANKVAYEARVHYRLSEDAAACAARDTALAVWRALGCRDAGRVDLRCDENGAPAFMEVNPLAGLHPQHSDLVILCRMCGLSYRHLIGAIVDSAASRIGGREGAALAPSDAAH